MNHGHAVLEGPRALFAHERFRFSVEITGYTVLPQYKGSVFRGAFMNAFRRAVCAAHGEDCGKCLLRSKCLYVALFEPSPETDFLDAPKFDEIPTPFVLNPPVTNRRSFRAGEVLEFELVLIGAAIQALPYFVFTFNELGRKGLGVQEGAYRLRSVDLLRDDVATRIFDGTTQLLTDLPAADDDPIAFSGDERIEAVTLHFLTPLRLEEKGDLVRQLTFPVFFERLSQRLTILSRFYGTGADLTGNVPIQSQRRDIHVTADELTWYEWERFSNRQNRAVKLGGLRGRITFFGALAPFMPWLRLGREVNLGLGTTFGLGRYRLTAHKWTKRY